MTGFIKGVASRVWQVTAGPFPCPRLTSEYAKLFHQLAGTYPATSCWVRTHRCQVTLWSMVWTSQSNLSLLQRHSQIVLASSILHIPQHFHPSFSYSHLPSSPAQNTGKSYNPPFLRSLEIQLLFCFFYGKNGGKKSERTFSGDLFLKLCHEEARNTLGQSIALLSRGKVCRNYLKKSDAWLFFLAFLIPVQ